MAYQITSDCTGCSYCAQWCPSGAITGRRKVRYTIESSKCLECGACGRICTFKAVLEPSGRLATRTRLSEWQKPCWNYALCDRCGECVTACPTKCIRLAAQDAVDVGVPNGYPFLSRVKMCIGCDFCLRECDYQAITLAAASQRVAM